MTGGNYKFFWPLLISLFILSLIGGVIVRFINESNYPGNQGRASVEPQIIYQPASFPSFIDNSQVGVDQDENAFLQAKNDYLKNQVKFVEIDLRKMTLKLYEAGEVINEMPVLTKGREGSWWETPSGNYKVGSKIVNGFSSIGKVWMPYSIQFYGNFFIHGWPYYPDGTPVASTYSGGCIRLSTENAKKVFQFADKGTPILVLDEPDFTVSPDRYLVEKASSDLKPPDISAKAAFITDLDSGLVLLDKNSETPLPVASLTKLMTGVTASELIYLEKTVKMAPFAFSSEFIQNVFTADIFSPFAAAISFIAGKNYTAFDLLYPLLMQSSNEAASLLASFLGEKHFVEQMNNKSQSLGMNKTTFTDASGKDDGNVGTAKDLAKLAKYTLEKRKFLFDISRGKDYLAFGPLNFGSLENYNEFYNESNLIGVKNGQTTIAKQTLMTVWNMKLEANNSERRIAIIVLGSEDRRADTQVLLDWLKNNFNLQ